MQQKAPTPTQAGPPRGNSLPPWKKVLYEKQPYEDNYVGESFLAGMIKNAHVQPYDFWAVVCESCGISQQVSIVAIFVTVFKFSEEGKLSVGWLIGIEFILVLLGYFLRRIVDRDKKFQVSFSFTSLLLILVLLSPVMRTLTLNYSLDTVWALVICLLTIHLFSQNYSFVNAFSEKFEATVSLNAAMFASVLVASRLPTALHSFAIITFAILLFGMFPFLRHHLRKFSEQFHLNLTFFLFLATFALLFFFNMLLLIVYVATTIFIILLCPLWLIYIQKFKDEIQGPWDEAVPGKKWNFH